MRFGAAILTCKLSPAPAERLRRADPGREPYTDFRIWSWLERACLTNLRRVKDRFQCAALCCGDAKIVFHVRRRDGRRSTAHSSSMRVRFPVAMCQHPRSTRFAQLDAVRRGSDSIFARRRRPDTGSVRGRGADASILHGSWPRSRALAGDLHTHGVLGSRPFGAWGVLDRRKTLRPTGHRS